MRTAADTPADLEVASALVPLRRVGSALALGAGAEVGSDHTWPSLSRLASTCGVPAAAVVAVEAVRKPMIVAAWPSPQEVPFAPTYAERPNSEEEVPAEAA